jgi:hypothetical protein
MAQGTTKGVPIDIDGTLANNSDLLVASQKATKTYVDNGLSLKQNTIGYTPVNKAGDTMIGNLILNANPTLSLGAATKDYVDTLINGIDWKQSANAATVASLPTYAVTGSGQILTGTTNGAIPSVTTDGVTLADGNRVLVKNETSTLAPNNGIYVVTQAGSGSLPFILTRASDANAPSELSEATLSVSAGTVLSNTQWHCNPASLPIVIGTTNITFAQIGSGVYTAGSGLTLTGNIFSITTNGVTDAMIQSATNWNTAYTNRITSLTTTGSSGAATLSSNTLNIPNYTLAGLLPSLTSGSVLFSNGTTIAQDNANFFWDNTNKRLGIGTATPSADVQISKGVNGAVAWEVKNTTTGTGAQSVMNFVADSSKTAQIQKLSTSFVGATAPLLAGDFGITNYSSGNIVFVNNFATGTIKFAAGGSSTVQVTIGTTGATTFTSSVTANSLIKSGGTSAQILAADGTVITAGTNITISGGTISSTNSGGTVTSVAALTLGTTGTDLSSSVANSTTTPVITLNVPTASATNRGALSSADWSTFNGKQAALNGTGFVKISGTTITYDNSTYYLASNPSSYIALTSLSSSATGLTYTNTTGVFSFTSGYAIPTTASATNWDTAYTNRITSLTTTGSSGAATLSSNTLNIPNYTLAGLGGFTNPMTTLGDIIYGGTSGAATRLGGNITATKTVLLSIGAGLTANAPLWGTLSASDVGAQASSTNLTSLAGLTYASASFVKMTAAGTFSLDTNTYLTANQSITLSGDVSGTGTTAITTTIGANKVTNAMLAQVATSTIKGRVTAGTGNVEDLTGTQATTLLDVFSSTLKGLAPASGGGTANFLRADGTWTAPTASMAIGGSITSATTGSVLFAGTSGVLAQDNANLFWDDTNNRLGIGVATPLIALDVSGGARIGGVAITGNPSVPAGTGPALTEGYYSVGGYAFFQGYNYTTSAYIPVQVDGSFISLNSNSSGNVLIGTTTNSTFKLDVNGTGRYQNNLTVSRNQNAGTYILASNTTSGTASRAYISAISDASSGEINIAKASTGWTVYKIIAAKDGYIYNTVTGGDIAILNDFATGTIKMAAGASTTAHVTIGTTGLTTFATGVDYKRLNPTTTTVASTATLTPDISAGDTFTITAQAVALSIANPTGTPVNGQKMTIRIDDNGTARAITWSGTQYRASTDLPLPTTTIATKTMYLGFIYNSTDTKWDLLAYLNNF